MEEFEFSYRTRRRRINNVVEGHLQDIIDNDMAQSSGINDQPFLEDVDSEIPVPETQPFLEDVDNEIPVPETCSEMCIQQDDSVPHDQNASCSSGSVEASWEIGVIESIPGQSDESSDSESNSDEEIYSIRENLTEWALRFNISHAALSALLKILSHSHMDLPIDARSLLSTPRETDVKTVAGGSYYHFGVNKSITSILNKHFADVEGTTLTLNVNIDGIPLFKSSNLSLWPILGMIKEFPDCHPFVIGIYSGMAKPNSVESYLQEFVEEMKGLYATGIWYSSVNFQVALGAIICDAPARAFLKCIKGHSGYNSCERCVQRGVHNQSRMTFLDLYAEHRSDASFAQKEDEAHHTGDSPFCQLNLGLVSQFPLDYMHLICLGVVRRLLLLWMQGPLSCRVSANIIRVISERLVTFQQSFPREFARKPRSLFEVKHWKATEFRTFLLYTGPVVLHGIIPGALYRNFMTLSVAMRILLNPAVSAQYLQYAEGLLKVFVQNFGTVYGKQFVVYNVHSLIHLVDDARKFGALDNISAFPFESFLGQLKKLVRGPHYPLSQIVHRIMEKQEMLSSSGKKCVQLHKKPHLNGPLPREYCQCKQFRQYCGQLFVSCAKGDNCFMVDGKVVIVRNILLSNGRDTFVVCEHFLRKEPFYTYPLESSNIQTFAVSKLSGNLSVFHVHSLSGKFVLLPFKGDTFIAIMQLHTP